MSDPNEEKAECPRWKGDYPIKQSSEHRMARRQLFSFLGVSGLVLGATAALAKTRSFLGLFYRSGSEQIAVADDGDLAVGESKVVFYPTENDPCLLIHLSEGEYVAYTQKCTHLMCPVHFNNTSGKIVCPCHSGYFSAKDGSVLAGPPPRALPSFPVEVKQGKIWLSPSVTG